jgi:peptide/nickel transport system permease protein
VGRYILRRLLGLIPLLLLITFIVFSLTLIIPGDPARTIAGGLKADPVRVAQVRRQLRLDEPVLQQYWHWLTALLHGNLGQPLDGTTQSVAQGIKTRFPPTLSLALGGMVVSLLIGIPAGIFSALRPGTVRDRSTTLVTSVGIAVPDFWLALLLVVALAVNRHVFPASGYTGITSSVTDWAKHLALPWIALGVAGGATIARQLRGAMIDVLDQDYMRTARAMGLRRRRIIYKYALRNAATPVLTLVGIQFAYLMGGTFIIEQIFSIPGLGSYILNAIDAKNLPVIQGVVLMVAIIFVVVNLIVDVAYGYLTPKARPT